MHLCVRGKQNRTRIIVLSHRNNNPFKLRIYRYIVPNFRHKNRDQTLVGKFYSEKPFTFIDNYTEHCSVGPTKLIETIASTTQFMRMKKFMDF